MGTSVFSKMFEMFCDDVGHVSALRIIVIPGAFVGMCMAAAGVVAMFYQYPAAGTALTVGAGMVATAQGAKAWQKQAETRSQNAGNNSLGSSRRGETRNDPSGLPK